MELGKIKSLLESKITEMGYEPISITRKVEKGDTYLSIVIDRVEPIDMDTIVKVSQELSTYLDEIDDSDEKYFLDISSLGAEKPLKIDSLKNYVGRYVNVHVNNALDGLNIFEGDIESVSEDSFTLSYRVKTRVKKVVILFNNIYKIRLAIKF
ncbi:MAG: ribosome maturation factor RimP [Bacilli bacterium]|nr:ribosome maturation factor RimP [Bacilli bacterium]